MFFLGVGIEGDGCVLGAAVEVEYHSRGWSAASDGHVEGLGDEAGAHVVGGGPTHDGAGVQVDDGRDVGPAVT